MSIQMLGIDHMKASIDVRTVFSFTKKAIGETLEKWKASYDVAKIQGVPAYVVNGKYLIYTKSIKSIDAMADLIRELASK